MYVCMWMDILGDASVVEKKSRKNRNTAARTSNERECRRRKEEMRGKTERKNNNRQRKKRKSEISGNKQGKKAICSRAVSK